MPANSYAVRRIVAGVVALFLSAITLGVLRTQVRFGFDPIGAAFGSCAAVVAILCWWFALHGHLATTRERLRFTVLCGLVVGGIGFALGFIGPLILAPGANQGPLLGIFVTGPAGFVLGAVFALVYRRVRARAAPEVQT